MSAVRDARQLEAVAAIHEQAVLEAKANGHTDTLNTERAIALREKAAAKLVPLVPLELTSGGEILPREGVLTPDGNRTLRVPGMVASEANDFRQTLLEKAGILALANDLAEDMEAENAVQRMTCHGIALAYANMFKLTIQAEKQKDEISLGRTLKLAMNFMHEMNVGISSFQKGKIGGKQVMEINHNHQHVTVNEGGQAVIGSVTGGQGGDGRTRNEGNS